MVDIVSEVVSSTGLCVKQDIQGLNIAVWHFPHSPYTLASTESSKEGTSACLLPSVSAFSLGELGQGTDSGQHDGEGSASLGQCSSQLWTMAGEIHSRVSRRQRCLPTGVHGEWKQ